MAHTYDPESLAKAARSGDADAQYRLASLLVASEEEAERGLEWLRKAAAAGHANARYTLALMTYKGHLVEPKPARAVSLLESVLPQAHPPARQFLAALYAYGYDNKAPDWDKALDLTVKAAQEGDPGACKDLALIMLVLGLDDIGHDWLWAAATRGDLMAAGVLVARYGDGDDRVPAGVARTWAEGLAQAGHPLAPVWAAAIEADPETEAPAPGPIPALGADLIDRLSSAAAGPYQRTAFLAHPRVDQITDFVSRPVAAHLIALARPHLQPPGEDSGGALRALLTASEMDLCAALVSARLAAAAGGTPAPGPLMMDASPPGAAGPLTEGGQFGDARVTAFLSLSDITDQGGLIIGSGSELIRPQPGTLLLLHHRLDDGAPDAEAVMTAVPGSHAVRWQVLRIVD